MFGQLCPFIWNIFSTCDMTATDTRDECLLFFIYKFSSRDNIFSFLFMLKDLSSVFFYVAFLFQERQLRQQILFFFSFK